MIRLLLLILAFTACGGTQQNVCELVPSYSFTDVGGFQWHGYVLECFTDGGTYDQGVIQ